MDQSKGGDNSLITPQKVICCYCGQEFEAERPEKYSLPKHKLPLNGKLPEKVGFCVGEGKRGRTIESLLQAGAEKKKEEKRKRDRERRQLLRAL